MLKKSRST